MCCSICKIMCNDMKEFISFLFFENSKSYIYNTNEVIYNIPNSKSCDSISTINSDDINENTYLINNIKQKKWNFL